MTTLPNKCYSGCHKATEEKDDQKILGKEIWRGKFGQQASDLAGKRWRRHHNSEWGEDKLDNYKKKRKNSHQEQQQSVTR